MQAFLVANASTILVSLILLVIIFFIVRSMIKDKRKGKGCGGSCSSCANCEFCHNTKSYKKSE